MNIRIPSRIKRAAKILFTPIPRSYPLPAFLEEDSSRESLLQRIKTTPASGAAHRELGDYYAKRDVFVSAIAEYRTALAFARTTTTVRSLANAYRAGGYSALAAEATACLIPPQFVAATATKSATVGSDDEIVLHSLDATSYQRLRATATRIKELYRGKTLRVLDVGGGDGALCLFLPEAEYVLAEPTTNGLTCDMALPETSFDVVVACHVLEHIPADARDGFLSQLCRKSRGQVLILGPFAVKADDDELAHRLVYEITKAGWAAEHIASELPTIESVKAFAERKGLPVTVTANGNAAAVFWMIFASYFAGMSGLGPELDRITRFFNAHLSHQMTNPLQPNDFIVELCVGGTLVQEGTVR
jgi:hypothetical protein